MTQLKWKRVYYMRIRADDDDWLLLKCPYHQSMNNRLHKLSHLGTIRALPIDKIYLGMGD